MISTRGLTSGLNNGATELRRGKRHCRKLSNLKRVTVYSFFTLNIYEIQSDSSDLNTVQHIIIFELNLEEIFHPRIVKSHVFRILLFH